MGNLALAVCSQQERQAAALSFVLDV